MVTTPNTQALTPRQRKPESISAVIPCYNEEEGLAELHRRLTEVLTALELPYEIVLVDDGSKDRTWREMQRLQQADPHLKVIKLSRNYGHQLALTCGLDLARGEVIVILDADLQDPPELLPTMIERWQEGFDVVYGQRRTREGEPPSKRFFAFMFYRLINQLAGFQIPMDTGDFRLLDRRALDALRSLRETQRFIRGMVSWIGFPQTAVLYDRPQRFAGQTKYPFKKSLLLALDAITSFSYTPLRFASYLGFALSVFAFLYIFVVIGLKIMDINVPGYTSLMATILLLGGVQLVVLGVMGEYVGRIFEQTKLRPLYFVESVHGEPLVASPHAHTAQPVDVN